MARTQSKAKAEKKKARKKPQKKGRASRSVAFDPRAAELAAYRLNRLVNEKQFQSPEELKTFLAKSDYKTIVNNAPKPNTPAETAQEMMYAAFRASGKRRVELAREALAVSEDCADAYVLLAEETAKTAEEAVELYEKGLQAGERALGPAVFKECEGRFWGVIETRPYMRAREGLGICLALTGRTGEALSHFNEMLSLNTADNQGIRFLLLRLLLATEKDEEANALLNKYQDSSADWAYAKALLAFRREGKSTASDSSLVDAFNANRYVPFYLGGLRKLPVRPPATNTPGEPNEAVAYVQENGDLWFDTPGAVKWLMMVFLEIVSAMYEDDDNEEDEEWDFDDEADSDDIDRVN